MIRNKTHFYKALVAGGWLLPKISTSICTMEFLHEVRAEKIFCPRLADVRFKSCPNPPTIEQLSEMIQAGIRNCLTTIPLDIAPRAARLADRLEKRKPDTAWLLAVLALLHPENEVFTKGYFPPKRQNPLQSQVEFQINNSDNLLTDLPHLSRKELLRGRNNIFLTKEEKLEAKLQAKMLRVQAMQESIARHELALDKIRNPEKAPVTISAAEY